MKRFFNRETLFTLAAATIYVTLVFIGIFATVFATDKVLSVFTGEALPMDALTTAAIMQFVAAIAAMILHVKTFPTYTIIWTVTNAVSICVMHSIYGMPLTTTQYLVIALLHIIGVIAVIVLPKIKSLKPFFQYMKYGEALKVNDYAKLSTVIIAISLKIIWNYNRNTVVSDSELTKLDEALNALMLMHTVPLEDHDE